MQTGIVCILAFSIILVPYSVNAQEFSYAIETYLPWNVQEDKTLAVAIISDESVTPEKINAVKNAILSEKTLSKDGQIFYEGWQGALIEASKHYTTLPMPNKFNVCDSNNCSGDIIIKLTNQQNNDGYSGFTQPITIPGQLIKSIITIYDVEHTKNLQLSAIVRHEFGHAMGLDHATNPDDLMHATIKTNHSFISSCDISGMVALYDGKKSSQISCV